jgi:biopolymer transport protein ExbB
METWITKGGVTIYPLLLCSIISLAIVVERLFFWFSERMKRTPEVREEVLHLVGQREYEQAGILARKSRDYLVRIFLSGLNHHDFSLEGALEMRAEREVKRMRKYLHILDTIITLGPLIGILGTILGIISSFDLLGAAGLEDPKMVTGGIAEALISTAVGLTVAIITLIPFNFFQAKVEDRVSEIEVYVTNFEVIYNQSTGQGLK